MPEHRLYILADVDIRTEGLPSEMKILLADYPREQWESHEGFKDLTKQWLGAHQMFRRVTSTLRTDAERYLDQKISADDYVAKLSFRGGSLVSSLHGHHGWEDHSYFPELSAADPRFDKGLEILEKDHAVLDEVLHQFTNTANQLIRRVSIDHSSARDETAALHGVATTIETLLQRHLGDEEELAVPIILHHRLRG